MSSEKYFDGLFSRIDCARQPSEKAHVRGRTLFVPFPDGSELRQGAKRPFEPRVGRHRTVPGPLLALFSDQITLAKQSQHRLVHRVRLRKRGQPRLLKHLKSRQVGRFLGYVDFADRAFACGTGPWRSRSDPSRTEVTGRVAWVIPLIPSPLGSQVPDPSGPRSGLGTAIR